MRSITTVLITCTAQRVHNPDRSQPVITSVSSSQYERETLLMKTRRRKKKPERTVSQYPLIAIPTHTRAKKRRKKEATCHCGRVSPIQFDSSESRATPAQRQIRINDRRLFRRLMPPPVALFSYCVRRKKFIDSGNFRTHADVFVNFGE